VEPIEEGQVSDFSPRGGGWLVGFGENFRDPTLRRMAKNALAHTVGIKWMVHERGDPNGTDKPKSDGCTLSVLVSPVGDFRVEFSRRPDFADLPQPAGCGTSAISSSGAVVCIIAGTPTPIRPS